MRKSTSLAVALLFLAAPALAAKPAGPITAVVGATVIDGNGDAPIPNATLPE